MENFSKQSDKTYAFLKKILDILFEEKAFVEHDDNNKSIVDFKYPEELMVSFISIIITCFDLEIFIL